MGVMDTLKSKKARPWLIGAGILIGGFVLYNLMARGGGASSGASAGAGGPSEQAQVAMAQIAAQTQGAQLAANVESSRIAAELAAFQYGKDADAEIAGRQLELGMYQAAAQTQLGLAGIEAQRSIAIMQEQTAQRGISAQENVQVAGLQSQVLISGQQFGFLTAQEESRRSVDIARINADVAINQANQKTARRGQSLGFLGSVIGGAFALFSDLNEKKALYWSGNASTRQIPGGPVNEFGRYTYAYKSDPGSTRFHGVIAQEVARVVPRSVEMVGRRLAVNYSMLPG